MSLTSAVSPQSSLSGTWQKNKSKLEPKLSNCASISEEKLYVVNDKKNEGLVSREKLSIVPDVSYEALATQDNLSLDPDVVHKPQSSDATSSLLQDRPSEDLDSDNLNLSFVS